jgi:LacI family transcriptional regulator
MKIPAKARMQDVANLAGVSLMTVSRTLSGSVPVSEQVRRKVHKAVATLNFRPNETARSLREGRSRSIGLIVPNFYDPFFAMCAHAITVVANAHSYSVIVTTSNEDPEIEFKVAGSMLRRLVDGMLVIPAVERRSKLNREEFRSTPIVTLDRPLRGDHFSSVIVDNNGGARMATSHLIQHRHKRICYLSLSRTTFTHRVRYEGYRHAMLAAGLVPRAYFNCGSREETYKVIRSMIDGPGRPTALFAGNNLVMRHLLHALSAMKVDIPGNMAVAGFDDFDMADIFHPALTVVRQPAHDLGRSAAELLFARLGKKQKSRAVKQIVLPVELIVRSSCGCNPQGEVNVIGNAKSRKEVLIPL